MRDDLGGCSQSRNTATSAVHRLRSLLLKESLTDDGPLDLVQIISTNLVRTHDTVPPRPRWWTEVRFAADAKRADEILQRFSVALRPTGWYLHCWTDSHIFLAFHGKVFKYARGDQAARDEAISYGLLVPKHQLDWEESLE